ncbi:MAG: dihydrodipicolinate synthase family protein [Desulfobacterales bacterium]|nr:dihydrodipicolinate synthase family protein [Desulfobacterales bacterium]
MSKKHDVARRLDHEQIRDRVAVYDFTMGLIEIKGKDAKAFLEEMCVNSIARLVPGQITYTSLLNEQAQMIDDVTVYCFAQEKFWMISAFKDDTLLWFNEHRGNRAVSFEDMSDEIALWSIQGPESRRLIASCMLSDMTDMKYYTFMENEIASVPVILSRTGFTGELGFEIFADATRMERIVDRLLQRGKKFGVKLIESDVTLESVPTEKGLVTIRDFRGNNPLELGMGWSVKWDKEFIGKKALEAVKKKGPARKLTGFVAVDDEIDIELESPVKIEGKVVGKVTTANYGYTVEKSIGYALVDANVAENGAKAVVETDGKKVEVTFCGRVFYDAERKRVNAIQNVGSLSFESTRDFLENRNFASARPIQGVFAAMPTPMLGDESLDVENIAVQVNRCIENGLDGILIGGNSGEFPSLSLEERKLLFKTSVEAASGRCKIVACTGANTTQWTKELCSYAGEIGADYVLVMTPYDPATTDEGIVAFYEEIADLCQVGVMIYHYPDATNVTMGAEEIAQLARHKNIVGIKNVADLSSTVGIVNATRHQSFSVLSGLDEVFLGTLAVGGDGFMGVGAAVAPALCRELYDSYQAGNMEKAQECHRKLCRIMEVVFALPFPGALKASVEVQGYCCGHPRRPSAAIDQEGRRQLHNILVQTGVMEG